MPDLPPEFRPGSAHLRTMREAAGLTVEGAADLVGVSRRSWQHWESPDSEQGIKDDVYETLARLIDRKAAMVTAAVEALETTAEEEGFDPDDGPVTLIRYRSPEQLERAHPGFEGGIGAHNTSRAHTVSTFDDRLAQTARDRGLRSI